MILRETSQYSVSKFSVLEPFYAYPITKNILRLSTGPTGGCISSLGMILKKLTGFAMSVPSESDLRRRENGKRLQLVRREK